MSRFFTIHFDITRTNNIARYTEDFAISRFVKSMFHCKNYSQFITQNINILFDNHTIY